MSDDLNPRATRDSTLQERRRATFGLCERIGGAHAPFDTGMVHGPADYPIALPAEPLAGCTRCGAAVRYPCSSPFCPVSS